jgi:ubiquinone/menaquinone biosynthesis C-methylase UbiE
MKKNVTLAKIIKENSFSNFTEFEKIISMKYTHFFNAKIKEKELNKNFIEPNNLIFMNDGYAELDKNGYPYDSQKIKNILLNPKFIQFKYQINLYKRLLNFADIQNNKNVKVLIDVGCGKGGGISFYKQFYNFDKCIGIDLTKINIELAKQHEKNVSFYVASATNLPINDKTVDIITSVESLMYYDPLIKFIQEANRVLKNNGKVLISMPLNEQEENNLEESFTNNGFILSKKEDITENVTMACAISKNRFKNSSFQESEVMKNDEQRYFNKTVFYKNFVFIKRGD